METPSPPELNEPDATAVWAKPRRWRRVLRRAAIVFVLAALCIAYLLRDDIRTLESVRRIPGTNAYVMDYYADYNMGQIRSQGMDVNNIEGGLIHVFFPRWMAAIAGGVKGMFINRQIETFHSGEHHCSTVMLHAGDGRVLFGRNFDWKHDACLIVKIHGRDGPSSIAVIDLHYLNLDRPDLDQTYLIQRIPLLFAPYYLQDGMNQYGVAVADMSVKNVKAPYDPAKPNVLHATAMRLILDYAKSTDEAVNLLREYNIQFAECTSHLMIADATGKSVVVEFIDGKLLATPGGEKWQACTNYRIAGQTEEENDARCPRYRLASDELAALPSVAGPDDVMKIMESVAQPEFTMWTSVYNLSTRELEFAYRQHYSVVYRDALDGSE